MLPFGAKNIPELVEIWNKKIPIDRWYREKYNIPFNSSAHRQVCLADMFYEFYESQRYNRIIKDKENNKIEEDIYIKGKGNFMKSVSYTQADIDKIFEELDLDSID